ncbi:MAG: hypothetical protein HGB10_09030 [Coriobacteriia bacterium]|nr:hypothetical protein [Coriobacteriia bacterium]
MTDDPTTNTAAEATPAPEPAAAAPGAAAGASAGEAWADVIARMGELGDAIATWTRAAADNPENRRRLDDVRRGVNEMATKADGAFAQMSNSDIGQQVASSAEEAGQFIGDTAQKVSEAAAPHVATAFAGLANAFGKAAQKVEEAATRQAAPAPPAPPAPDAAPAPAATAHTPEPTPEPPSSGE